MKHAYGNEHPHRLYRDAEGGLLLGVCSGIAEHFDWSVWLVRIATFALGWFFPVTTVIAYVVAALIMPERPLRYYGDGDERSFWHSHRHRS